ncbi:MAG: CRISPR-associated endonuclease Cas2 [Parcubacteria group bacterium]|nr:CRISPR-associated endonuclease Cas2 [Parcubacteria group bacterium]
MFHRKIRIPLTAKALLAFYDCAEGIASLYAPLSRRELYNNFFNNISYFERKVRRKELQRARFAKWVYGLKRAGYLIDVKRKNLKGGEGFIISEKGFRRIGILKTKIASKQKRADKRWYMVIFDVPESRRRIRDNFRECLYNLGFKQLQQSVFISPYEIDKELKDIIKLFMIDEYVRCFIIREREIK